MPNPAEPIYGVFTPAQREALSHLSPTLGRGAFVWVTFDQPIEDESLGFIFRHRHLDSVRVLTEISRAQAAQYDYEGPYALVELSGCSLGQLNLDTDLIKWLRGTVGTGPDRPELLGIPDNEKVSAERGSGEKDFLVVKCPLEVEVMEELNYLAYSCSEEVKEKQARDETEKDAFPRGRRGAIDSSMD